MQDVTERFRSNEASRRHHQREVANIGCHLTTLNRLRTLSHAPMQRPKHPNKEIDDAVRHAERNGWRIKIGGSHAWGKIYCPYNDKDCRCGEFCITSVWSTPRNAGSHSRQLKRVVDNCKKHKQRADAAKIKQKSE